MLLYRKLKHLWGGAGLTWCEMYNIFPHNSFPELPPHVFRIECCCLLKDLHARMIVDAKRFFRTLIGDLNPEDSRIGSKFLDAFKTEFAAK